MHAISVNWTAIQAHQKEIGSQGIHLYMVLAGCVKRGKARTADISLPDLAKLTGWSERKVLEYLSSLERAGLIKRIRNYDQYGRPIASSYQLLA